jgi:hypothetical protein
VTLLAFHLGVQAREGVSRLTVVKLSGRVLPIHKVVALDAVGTKTPFVKILVTGCTGLRNAKERLAEVLRLDVGTFRCRNLFG